MPTVRVEAGSSADLQEIADSLFKAKKVVVITGAGISTNSGIPDFRSEHGLYAMIQGQFDAAARLDGARPDDGKGGDDERPRKRRRMSHSPVGDTIEVVDQSCIEAKHHVASDEEEPRLDPENGINDGDQNSPVDAISDPDSRDGAVLSKETVLAEEWKGDSNSSLARLKEVAQVKSGGESRPTKTISIHEEAQEQEQEQGTQSSLPGPTSVPATAEHFTMSSPILPAHSLPPTEEYLTSSQRPQHQHQHHKLIIAKPLAISADPSLRIVSSSGPSTPKQSTSSSVSGAQTTTLSSPLSSPPPILSDPYEEQLNDSHSPSSRCTSPDLDDDAPSSSMQPFQCSQTFKNATLSTLKGRDLFDASIWSDPLKTSVFYTFATNLRQKSRDASPSGSHHFISHLRNSGKMVRCYTQNIDLLEDKVGLATHLLLGTGSRSRFSARNARATAAAIARQDTINNDSQSAEQGPVGCSTNVGESKPGLAVETVPAKDPTSNDQGASLGVVKEATGSQQKACRDIRELAEGSSQESSNQTQDSADSGSKQNGANSSNLPKSLGGGVLQSDPSSPEPDRGVECVYLHGSLRALRCFQCGGVVDWDEGDRELQTMSGQQPPCPRCEDATAARQERGKRALGVGKLRPDIVLYGEEHPEYQQISDIIQHDLSLAPDMLIIMGTSLKVHGLKTVVKEFAKAVHNKKEGKVIFINYTKPADSVWADTIDFWVQMDCDAWVDDLKEKKPLIWLPPGAVAEECRNNKRRRRTNNEAEKPANKKLIKAENSDATSTVELSSKSKKSQKKEVLEDTKPSEPKAQPKRPAAFRDHKANGAFLTTKINRDLAAISGRVVVKHSPISAAAKEFPRQENAGSQAETPVAPRPILRKGRGPRLRNARTRKPESKVDTSTKGPAALGSMEGYIRSGTNQTADEGASHNLVHHAGRRAASGSKATSGHARLPSLAQRKRPDSHAKEVEDTAFMKQEASPPSVANDQAILAEMPVPNSGTDSLGEDNSILAAVKSHHRIRKPKTFFESKPIAPPKTERGTPAPGNAKSKAKPTSQGKKARSSSKTTKMEPARQTPILPPPRPHPATSASAPASTSRDTTAPRQLGTAVELITLPPLHPLNFQNYKYPTPNGGHSCPPAQPPAYLEPTVVVEGPPLDLSPTTSPQHWRKRAFSFRDPQSRHFEGPCRGLDFTATPPVASPAGPPVVMGVPSSLGPPTAQLTAQLAKINAAPSMAGRAVLMNAPSLAPPELSPVDARPPPGIQSVDDSPNRQLQRENEAAAALSQLRSPPVFDDRRFAMI